MTDRSHILLRLILVEERQQYSNFAGIGIDFRVQHPPRQYRWSRIVDFC